MKTQSLSIAIFSLIAIVTGAARADVVVWRLTDVTFLDGGVATGFLTMTDDVLTNWSVSVSGGNTSVFPALVYSPKTGVGRGAPFFVDLETIDSNRQNRRLQFFPFDNIGGHIPRTEELDLLSVETVISDNIQRTLKIPALTVVPEPSALTSALCGAAILAVASFVSRRRRR